MSTGEKRGEKGSANTRRPSAEEIQTQLDEALADSFPASDPVSIVTSQNEESWSEPGLSGNQTRQKN